MIQFVQAPARHFVALILTQDPGRRKLRFLFRYQAGLRAMTWMYTGLDGSLYLNPRRRPAPPMIHGQGLADGRGGFAKIEWVKADDSTVESRKVSYHVSGRVKGGSNMTQSVNIRNIDKSTLIRQDEYAHPSKFEAIDPNAMRLTDLVIPCQDGEAYRLDDEHPLASRVSVAPLQGGKAQVAILDDDPDARAGQTAVVIPATNLKDCQDLTYQVQFFSRSGKWPDVSMVAVLNVTATEPPTSD